MRAKHRVPPTLVAALALGLIHALSLSVAGAWWLQLVAFGLHAWLCLVAIERAATRVQAASRAAVIGFAFGLGWFVGGVCWLFISMHRYGGMPAPIAALALVLFCAYLAIFPAAGGALAAWLNGFGAERARQPSPSIAFAITLSATLTLAELLRGWLFTGFPWLSPGYAHTDGPFAGLAPISGVFGVGAAACLATALVACAVRDLGRLRRIPIAPILVALCLALCGPLVDRLNWASVSGDPLRIDLIQGNVGQDMKFDPARARAAMDAYVRALQRSRAQLTVLPETAWTVPWPMTPPEVTENIRNALADGALVAIGMPLFTSEAPRQLTNSVAVIGAEGVVSARYDKTHLVPFGEFIPWGFRWFVAMMNIPLGDFGRGADHQPMPRLAGQAIAFNICYEDLFGDQLAGQVRAGANVLINVSNIAWFGDSHAQEQHLQIARMRARELARPMLRSTNTGVTAAIDHRGMVIARLPGHAFGMLQTRVEPTSGLTPFARWANLPAWLWSLMLLAAGVILARRR